MISNSLALYLFRPTPNFCEITSYKQIFKCTWNLRQFNFNILSMVETIFTQIAISFYGLLILGFYVMNSTCVCIRVCAYVCVYTTQVSFI